MYYLVQFVDDGILAIVTDKDLKTRDSDGLKEARYGDTYHLCTVMYESGELTFHSMYALALIFYIGFIV